MSQNQERLQNIKDAVNENYSDVTAKMDRLNRIVAKLAKNDNPDWTTVGSLAGIDEQLGYILDGWKGVDF